MTSPQRHQHALGQRLSRLAGRITARDQTTAGQWATDLLHLRPHDRVLNLGCGTGTVLAELVQHITSGVVVGVDSSAAMIAQARVRNQPAIEAGRVKVHLASGKALPYPAGCFTKVCVIETATIWPTSQAGFTELRRLLAPSGRLVLILEERDEHPGHLPLPQRVVMSAEDIEALTAALRRAGLVVHTEQRQQIGDHWHRALIAHREQPQWVHLIARAVGMALPVAGWVLVRNRSAARAIFRS